MLTTLIHILLFWIHTITIIYICYIYKNYYKLFKIHIFNYFQKKRIDIFYYRKLFLYFVIITANNFE